MTDVTTIAITAPTIPDQSRIAALSADAVPVGAMAGNFSRETPEFAELLFASDEPATNDKEDHLTEPFPVRWWVAKKTTLISQATQEETAAVRLVLISPDLKTMAFSSGGAVDSWDLIRAIYGDGPYETPLQIIVHPVRTRAGRTMIRLRPSKKGGN